MILVATMAMAGGSLGILLADATIPTYKRLPTLSAAVLILLVAASIVWFDATNFGAAILFLGTFLVSSTGYAAARWNELMPELSPSRSWYFRAAFSRPAYLRDLYRQSQAGNSPRSPSRSADDL